MAAPTAISSPAGRAGSPSSTGTALREGGVLAFPVSPSQLSPCSRSVGQQVSSAAKGSEEPGVGSEHAHSLLIEQRWN